MSDRASQWHETDLQVRSYELDSFGHVNHAVFLGYLEHARFQAMEDRGFPPSELERRSEGVHVVRVEVDYRREARMGQPLRVCTRGVSVRNSSMTLEQRIVDPTDPDTGFVEARVVAVWIGSNGRPVRIPDDVRRAFGFA